MSCILLDRRGIAIACYCTTERSRKVRFGTQRDDAQCCRMDNLLPMLTVRECEGVWGQYSSARSGMWRKCLALRVTKEWPWASAVAAIRTSMSPAGVPRC